MKLDALVKRGEVPWCPSPDATDCDAWLVVGHPRAGTFRIGSDPLGELERTRRDLAAALALARPSSPTRLPIGTHLAAIDAELASRTGQLEAPDPSPPVEELLIPLEDTRHLRMVLDLLEERLPPAYTCDGLESELLAHHRSGGPPARAVRRL